MIRDILDFCFFLLAFVVPICILALLLTVMHGFVSKTKSDVGGRE